MNQLDRRLASLRRRLHLVHLGRGVGSVLAIALGGAVLVGLADWQLRMPSTVRALALIAILSGAAYVAMRFLLAPLSRKTDDLSLALQVEEEHPHLNDALASTVEFLKQPENGDTSPVLRREAVQRALRLAQGVDFEKIIDRRGLRVVALAALAAIAIVAFCFFSVPDLARTAFLRLTDPFGQHSWTRLAMGENPTRIAMRQPYTIRGQVSGILPSQIRIELEGAGQSEKIIPLKLDRETKATSFAAPLDMAQQRTSFKFRVWANDGVYPSRHGWHEVEVLPPPELANLDGLPSPHIELRFPKYTDRPWEKLSPGKKDLEFVAGTQVTLKAATNRPIVKAWIDYKPENSSTTTAVYLGTIGHFGWNALGILAGASSACDKVPATISEDGQKLSVSFQPWLRGAYVLHLVDNLGLPNPIDADLRVYVDPVPEVTLEKPAANQSLLPDAEVLLKAFAEDDLAVRGLYLEYRRKDAEGNWHDAVSARLPLFEHDEKRLPLPALVSGFSMLTGRPITSLLGGISLVEFARADEGARPKMKRADAIRRWPLSGLVREGDTVVIRAVGADFNDIVPFNPGGASHEIELRIIGKSELSKLLDEGMAEVQQKVVRAQQLQEEAMKLVKEVQNSKKAGPLQHEQILDAEQKQKQIQEQIGMKDDEGIRGDLNKLKQMLRDNKLPPSPMQDRLRKLSGELERMTQEELQEIERNLADARKELGREEKDKQKAKQAEKGKEQSSVEKKNSLEKAAEAQKEANASLKDLVKFLDPWANMQQIKGRARDILQKQRDLKRETEKLGKEGMKDDGKIADAQQSLTERTQDLINMMKEVEEKRQKEDPKNAKLIRDAAKAVADTPDTMKEARELLKENRPQSATQKQTQSIKDLEKAIAALEERRDEELDVLRKKNKDFQEKLDDLANKQDELQKKVKKAMQNPNEAQRKEELAKLAKEQEKLQEEAEKLRDLARLQADRANRDLAKAAQEMEKAAKQLQAGQNPEEAQDQALERIDEAMEKLEEEAEELAREQLAKIADEIKGLKERQDAQIERSTELHKRVLQAKRWSRQVFPTLDANTDVQRGLASETETLKGKVKDAKVFDMILDKASKAMIRAADSMKERKETAVERQDEFEPEIEKDEHRRHGETLKHQQEASRRLGRVLDALKQELAKMDKKDDEPGEQKGGQGGEGGQQGGLRAQDGIPAMAQLKALREEQQEVNDRTKDFADRRPDPKVALTPAERAELRELEAEQARIQDLFNEITTPKKDMP